MPIRLLLHIICHATNVPWTDGPRIVSAGPSNACLTQVAILVDESSTRPLQPLDDSGQVELPRNPDQHMYVIRDNTGGNNVTTVSLSLSRYEPEKKLRFGVSDHGAPLDCGPAQVDV